MKKDFLALLLAATIPLALVLSFPRRALTAHPLPSPAPTTAASCTFLTLSPEAERDAMAAARTTWQHDHRSLRHLRTILLTDHLPTLPPNEIGHLNIQACAACHDTFSYTPETVPISLAAPPPQKIAPRTQEERLPSAFSKDELLRLN